MIVRVTAGEVLERGVWDSLCEMLSLNPWSVNEGLMDSNETFDLTVEQAEKLGFIKND